MLPHARTLRRTRLGRRAKTAARRIPARRRARHQRGAQRQRPRRRRRRPGRTRGRRTRRRGRRGRRRRRRRCGGLRLVRRGGAEAEAAAAEARGGGVSRGLNQTSDGARLNRCGGRAARRLPKRVRFPATTQKVGSQTLKTTQSGPRSPPPPRHAAAGAPRRGPARCGTRSTARGRGKEGRGLASTLTRPPGWLDRARRVRGRAAAPVRRARRAPAASRAARRAVRLRWAGSATPPTAPRAAPARNRRRRCRRGATAVGRRSRAQGCVPAQAGGWFHLGCAEAQRTGSADEGVAGGAARACKNAGVFGRRSAAQRDAAHEWSSPPRGGGCSRHADATKPSDVRADAAWTA